MLEKREKVIAKMRERSLIDRGSDLPPIKHMTDKDKESMFLSIKELSKKGDETHLMDESGIRQSSAMSQNLHTDLL